jgi:hypothetical protein
MKNEASPRSRFNQVILEGCGLLGLIGLVLYFLAISWRRWPDPIVDFGRELYLPWRLARGAVLYRDVDDYYGPLSQYLNALLFRCAGPGLMHLVAANLMVFAGILGLIYLLFRRAWGVIGALAASALFVSVFAFSQYNWCGNFDYATPYSHETTHGLLVCLLLVLVLDHWIAAATVRLSFLAGLLAGCACVLKAEIMLAAGLLLLAAIALRRRNRRPLSARLLGWLGLGAGLPTLFFTAYFACFMPWNEAVVSACRAWLNAADARYSATGQQLSYLGLDQPWANLGREALATVCAVLLLGVVIATACLADRLSRVAFRVLLVAFVAGLLIWLGVATITWTEVGRCLPGLLAIYLASLIPGLRAAVSRTQALRFLLAVLAAALLARMILNARIYHFGYYQAALTAIMIPAVMLGEIAPRLRLGRAGGVALAVGTLALLLPGVFSLCQRSGELLAMKTVPVGAGADRFYAPSTALQPTRGDLVNVLSQALSHVPAGQTAIVLPEGTMINYLARVPSPVATVYFFGSATENGREERVVADLQRHSPDWVVILSRDLREMGVQRYGDRPGGGLLILEWVAANYESVGAWGGDPLDVDQRGAVLLRRKNVAH